MSIKNIEDLIAGEWANLEVKAEQIWENEHPSIRQVGVLTDDTGIIKFVAWEKSNLPLVEEGVTYRVGKVVVTEYDGKLQVALVSTTEIERVTAPTPVQPEIPVV